MGLIAIATLLASKEAESPLELAGGSSAQYVVLCVLAAIWELGVLMQDSYC